MNTIKRLILNLLVVPFLLVNLALSCDHDEHIETTSLCAVANPKEDLPWLKTKIEQLVQSDPTVAKYFYVEQGVLNGETVFIFPNCCPQCNSMVPVYNCKGEQLFTLSDQPERYHEIKNIRILRQPDNFACSR